ncbi:battenin, partial [Tremellales sp. Uapishka_1]
MRQSEEHAQLLENERVGDGADLLDEEGEDVHEFLKANDTPEPFSQYARHRLFAAFSIFGLLNNVLYVIILSAALDLVSSTTPKGLVALFNIFPALLAKVFWPLISNGKIRYTRRVLFCTLCSWLGIVTIAFSSSLYPRLLGISLASLSSGLGELTFLQLTTTLPTRRASKTAVGAWASGTGFAGIAGAGIWWLLRGLGVRLGLGVSSVLPLFFPLIYFFLLPPFSHFQSRSETAYQPLPTSSTPSIVVSLASPVGGEGDPFSPPATRLSTTEKMELLRPLLLRYMLPLFAVYVEEYVINTGVSPTLVFPLPISGLWSRIFKSSRDYYPFWSLTYQTFVFISRSSLSLGVPALPIRLLPLPSFVQSVVLTLLALQSRYFIFTSSAFLPPSPISGVDRSISLVFLLICLEGLCGGSSYVNTFYHVGREGEDGNDEDAKTKLQREFRIGVVGASDSCGILFASLISMPLEIALCNSQVAQGRSTCREL